MVRVNVKYTNLEAAVRFVESCEANFAKEITKTCDSILSDHNIKIITLCGPTCSGKTTTASLLTAAIERMGKRARVLSIDDFYNSEDHMIEKGITDYESVEAIDLELLKKVVDDLVNCRKTALPTFDFKTRSRTPLTEYVPNENDIYIIEGIQAMYPEVSDILGKERVKSIYISVAKNLDICGVVFQMNEIRLVRRIVRDFFYRNSTVDDTMLMWHNVRKNEDKNIFPYSKNADHIINSLLPYEPFVISSYFMDITAGYSGSGKNYELITSLRQRLSKLTGSCITSAIVPMDSVFREFIV